MLHVKRTLGCLALVILAVPALAEEIPPGRITNPDGDGLQFFMSAGYNSVQDEYIITYEGGIPYAIRLSPTTKTIIGSQITLGPQTPVQDTWIAYNAERNEYLAVWRTDSPQIIYGRYLDGNGQPLGNVFTIAGGVEPRVVYNPVDRRYLVAYYRYVPGGPSVYYRMVEGDSTKLPTFLTGEILVATNSLSSRVAYNSVSNQFLIVFARDGGPPNRSDVQGRFVTGAGAAGANIAVAGGFENQQTPEISYCASVNAFLVAFEDWSTGGFPDINAHLLSGAGAVLSPRFNTTPGDPGWNVAGPNTCNSFTGTFYTTEFVQVFANGREVNPANPAAPVVGPKLVLSNENAFPLGITSRPDPFDPQIFVVWRNVYGADGVHGGIVHLPPPPPKFISNQMPVGFLQVAYSEKVPVAGGKLPLTYMLVSGGANVPPGLSGPNAEGKFEGIPSSTGTFGPFRVKVTDADNKMAEADLFHTITLKPPTPTSPLTATNNTTPTFTWTATPGATSYQLIIENVTDGGTVLDQSGIGSTSFPLGTPLVTGKIYRWKVRATNGAIFSDYSSNITFEVDTTAPAAVNLTGRVALGGTIQLSGLVATASTGDEGVNTKDKLVDTILGTYWSTPGRAVMQNESITVDLGLIHQLRRIRLRSRSDNGSFFPRDFQIQLSTDNVNFTAIHTANDFVAAAATWYTFDFANTLARYVRIFVTESNQHASGVFFVQLAELEAHIDGFVKLSGVSAFATSGQSGSNTAGAALDGNSNTYWSTPGRSPMQTEFITLNLGGSKEFSRVRMQARADNGAYYPRDFRIEVSDDNASYTTVLTQTNVTATNGQWLIFNFAPVTKSYVKIVVTKSNMHSSGVFFVQLAEIEVARGTPAAGALEVSWDAPGDDGVTGTAASYDIRYQQGTGITYSSATQATGEPAPAIAGTAQSFEITGLLDEMNYTIALKTIDDAGNVSPMSNAVTVATLGTPPAAVDDLVATPVSGTEIKLDWLASGDDGEVGTATTYDIRYALSVITSGTYPSATEVSGEPAPLIAGSAQTMTVSGLEPDTLYFFGMLVLDEVGNASALSNVVSARTLDTAPPAAVTDLAAAGGASAFTYTKRGATAISASGEEGSNTRDKAVDTLPGTMWGSPGRLSPVQEHITLDFGVGMSYSVGRVRMCARFDNGAYFPRDFQIQLSNDNANYAVATTVTNFATGAGVCTNFDFTPATARYVRVLATKSNQHPAGAYYVQIAEIELYQAVPLTDGALLTWTAPGDSGMVGTATSYDLRYSAAGVIDTNAKFNAAMQVAGEPPPKVAGSLESFLVTGLPAETTLYFALKTSDEVPNVSALSNSPMFTTPGIPPNPIDDLAATVLSGTQIRLDWLASGDDGDVGVATSYDIRYSTSPITTQAHFDAATTVTGEPAPGAFNSPQTYTVTGLTPDTLYYFAMVVLDEVGNTSSLSNVPSARTQDTAPPAAVTNLMASAPASFAYTPRGVTAIAASGEDGANTRGKAVDGLAGTMWSTPGRGSMVVETLTLDFGVGNSYSVGRIQMCARADNGSFFPKSFNFRFSADNVVYTTAHTVTNFSTTAGTCTNFDFTPAAGRYVQLQVTASNQHPSGQYFVQVAEMVLFEATPVNGAALLAWTAPGDSGMVGTATSYDIRYAMAIIDTDAKFNAATQVAGEPAPKVAGSAESFVVNGLAAETIYYFALKTSDEIPNVSALSNSPAFTTPGIPPNPIDDLAATVLSGTQIRLDWLATGDDGDVGTATSYDIRYSTSPITTQAHFDAATTVTGEPVPGPFNTPQTYTVTGLTPDTLYYFAIIALDNVGNASSLSNVPSARTQDTAPPAAVTNLMASAPASFAYTPRGVTAIAASGEDGANTRGKAVDGLAGTMWSTPGRGSMVVETLTLDFGVGNSYSVGRIQMCARADNGSYFPKSFNFRFSADDVVYTTAHTVTNFSTTAGACTNFDFTPAAGRYVQLQVTASNQHPSGQYFVQVAEMVLFETTPVAGGALLTWTAPGDSGMVGTATSYDIRYAMAIIDTDAKFNAATQVAGEPAPKVAGSAESFVVTGLAAETIYYFALKTSDEIPNVSALSNSPAFTTPGIPPNPIDDLAATVLSGTQIRLDWLATGDDGDVGTATSYDIRYSTSPITTQAHFDAATTVTGEPVPGPFNTPQTYTVTGLNPDTLYYFAIIALDNVGNASSLSNVPSATTQDTAPPAAVTNLAASTPAAFVYTKRAPTAIAVSGEDGANTRDLAVDSNAGTFWSTPGRPANQVETFTMNLGASFPVARVRLCARADNGAFFPRNFQIRLSTDNVVYNTALNVNNFATAAGACTNFDFAATSSQYVQIYVTLANQHPSGFFFVQLAEAEAYDGVAVVGGALLTWTAPGDSGMVGTAASYDIRYSTTGIIDTDAKFNAATELTGEPAPKPAGSAESYLANGLPSGTIFFAIKTKDPENNISALSNSPSLVIP